MTSLTRGSRHDIPVRRPNFDFARDIPHHWLAGNALATHVFNGLNLVFPDGERFFIDAVRAHMERIADPELTRQIRGFFGQEGRHAHEHQRYFETLEAQGYEIQGFLRRFRAFTRWCTRRLPAPLRLSMTAGAEHYTATLGALVLSDGFIDGAHPVLRDLIIWHATEEVEHKAVAFDVLQATHPSLLLRWLGFAVATLCLFGWAAAGTRMLIRQDLSAGRLSREQLREMRGALRARRTRGAEGIGAGIRAYLRGAFHPNDVDDLALARRRLRELGLEPAGSA
jgi:predicted metal-dependent hydrolase